jgi:hypothetical protein
MSSRLAIGHYFQNTLQRKESPMSGLKADITIIIVGRFGPRI